MIRIVAQRPVLPLANDRRNPATQVVLQHDRSWSEITALASKVRSGHKITIDSEVVVVADAGVESRISRSIERFYNDLCQAGAFAAKAAPTFLMACS
jgi:hypothetical protein